MIFISYKLSCSVVTLFFSLMFSVGWIFYCGFLFWKSLNIGKVANLVKSLKFERIDVRLLSVFFFTTMRSYRTERPNYEMLHHVLLDLCIAFALLNAKCFGLFVFNDLFQIVFSIEILLLHRA